MLYAITYYSDLFRSRDESKSNDNISAAAEEWTTTAI